MYYFLQIISPHKIYLLPLHIREVSLAQLEYPISERDHDKRVVRPNSKDLKDHN